MWYNQFGVAAWCSKYQNVYQGIEMFEHKLGHHSDYVTSHDLHDKTPLGLYSVVQKLQLTSAETEGIDQSTEKMLCCDRSL